MKTNNILIQQTGSMNDDDAFTAILCDFGIARIIGTPVVKAHVKPFAFGLTPRYCSPEVWIIFPILLYIPFNSTLFFEKMYSHLDVDLINFPLKYFFLFVK